MGTIMGVGWKMDIAMTMNIGGMSALDSDTGMDMSIGIRIGWGIGIDGTATADMSVGMSERMTGRIGLCRLTWLGMSVGTIGRTGLCRRTRLVTMMFLALTTTMGMEVGGDAGPGV